VNPIGLVLVVGGILAVIVGVRGTQSGTFAALTGKSGATGATVTAATQTTAASSLVGGTPVVLTSASPTRVS